MSRNSGSDFGPLLVGLAALAGLIGFASYEAGKNTQLGRNNREKKIARSRSNSISNSAPVRAAQSSLEEISDNESVTDDALDTAYTTTSLIGLRQLRRNMQDRLEFHIEGLADRRLIAAEGQPSQLNVKFAMAAVSSESNNFAYVQKKFDSSNTDGKYIGIILGRIGSGTLDGVHTIVARLNVVMSEHGKGTPLMQSFIHAELPMLNKAFKDNKVVMLLESVENQIAFYTKLGFTILHNEDADAYAAKSGLTKMYMHHKD